MAIYRLGGWRAQGGDNPPSEAPGCRCVTDLHPDGADSPIHAALLPFSLLPSPTTLMSRGAPVTTCAAGRRNRDAILALSACASQKQHPSRPVQGLVIAVGRNAPHAEH